jgi:phosphomevalonate kinase
MGRQASVPIEPPSQSALLDDSLKVKGVLLAGVPGAGGYDAIVCLIAADDGHRVFNHLQRAWEGREERVCPLLAQQAKKGLILTIEGENA